MARLLLGLALFLTTHAGIASAQVANPSFETDDEQVVLDSVKQVLGQGVVGRMYFGSAACRSYSTAFPKVTLTNVSGDARGLLAVQLLFQADSHVHAFERPSGVVRIMIGEDIPRAVLNMRISRVELDPYEQFNAQDAMNAVTDDANVRNGMRSHGIRFVERIDDHLVVPPDAGLREGYPHLPPVIRSMTVDQAFDLIAKTFHGIAVFGGCKKPAVVDYGFLFLEQ